MKSIKTTLTAFLMGCVATPALATEVSDTLVIEDVNKVKIETQDTVQRIVISGAKDDPEFHYVQRISIPDSHAVRRTTRTIRDFNRISINRNGKPAKWSSSLRFNLGLGAMLDAPDNYDFKLWPSFEIGFGTTHDWHPFGKKNEWSIGWNLNWNHYQMGKDYYFEKDAQGMVSYTGIYPAGAKDRSTTLNRFSLQVPLLYTHYFDNKQTWSLSLGAIINWNVYGTANRDFNLNDEDYSITTNHIGQMPFTFDGIVKIGLPVLPDLYVKYSPSKFFRDSRGPKMHQLSFGICL